MVSRIFLIISVALVSGCSPRQWWGEKAPPPKVAIAPVKVSDCPSSDKIITGSDAESVYAMSCLDADVAEAWNKVQGSQKSTLRSGEISQLVEKGILDLSDGDRLLSHKKVHALTSLLGIKRDVTKADTNLLLSWVHENRTNLRLVYRSFTDSETAIKFKDIRLVFDLLSSYLRLRKLNIPRDDLGKYLNELLANDSPTSVIPETTLVVHDFLGALCPGHAESGAWNGEILAGCFDSLSDDFISGEAWIDFMLDQRPNGIYTRGIHDSLKMFAHMVGRRVSLAGLDGLHPELWVNLAAKLNAKPPEGFISSLNAIHAFEPNSNGKFLDPKVFNVAFRVIEDMHQNLLTALPVYESIMNSGRCINGDETNWRKCVLPPEAVSKNDSLKLIDRVVNPNFGKDAFAVNGKRFKKILLFQALAKEILRAFDKDGDGIISATNSDDDEVMNLLGVALSSVDSVSTFINNMKDRSHGVVLKKQEDISKYDHLNMALRRA